VQRREELLARIATLPGVEAVAAMNCPPLESDCMMTPVAKVDERVVERDEFPPIEVHVVSRDFLRAAGIRLRAGRSFDNRERPGRVTAAVLNQSAARLLWKGASPIGRRMSTVGDSTLPVEIVGVVDDVKYDALEAPVRPAIYFDVVQYARNGGSVMIVRSRGDPIAPLPAIRRIIAEADPTAAVYAVATGDEMLARATSSTRFVAMLLLVFGILAALLAALGVYGVLAYLVSQRRREFGVRMAIGAHPSSLLALVVRQGVVLTVAGLVVGVIGALAATRLLSSFLFGVARGDVATYAVIVTVVGVVGVVAAVAPGRRATQVDPIIALRE
jgi:predicted permease